MNQGKLLLEDISYTYPDGRTALKNIGLRINEGETVGIVGANGAGKSTLLMVMTGLLAPSSGSVWVDGEKYNKDNLKVLRKKLGFIMQNPDDQLFMTSVYEDVAFGPRNLGFPEKEVEARVKEALSQTGISELASRPPYRLSEGEKRAAAIAAVLSMEPEILFMDEPTSTLDPRARRRMIRLFGELHHTRILTSHDMDLVFELCSRTIIIKDGTILADGKTRELLSDRALMDRAAL